MMSDGETQKNTESQNVYKKGEKLFDIKQGI